MPLAALGVVDSNICSENVVLEFLGRADFQVKIRGYRVELGEIERACEAVAGIEAAVILALASGDQTSKERRLVAYMTPSTIDISRVKTTLRETLPSYMVPEVIVLLNAMPLTMNGKTDRKALEAMDVHSSTQAQRPVRQLQTPAEKEIAQAFIDVLDLSKDAIIGADDDFFELGGHSLLALRLQNRLKAAGSSWSTLQLQDVFRLRTPARIAATPAAALAQRSSASVPPPLLPATKRLEAERSGKSYSTDASFAQERLWLVDQLNPQQSTYNIPFAYRLSGPGLSVHRLEAALRQLVGRHQALRTTFKARPDGSLSQCIQPAPFVTPPDVAADV